MLQISGKYCPLVELNLYYGIALNFMAPVNSTAAEMGIRMLLNILYEKIPPTKRSHHIFCPVFLRPLSHYSKE